MAQPQIEISEKMLREEFAWRCGRQVVVRDIEVESLEKAQKILGQLQAGDDFAKLAWRYSIAQTAAAGGLLEPIGLRSKNVPPAIRQAALSLEKEGEVSDVVQVEARFHLLRLEGIIEPKGVKFEDVRDRIEQAVREDLIRSGQKMILKRISRDGKIDYVNPVLKSLVAEGSRP